MNHQTKAKSRIYWQYKNSPKLISWLLTLPGIAQASIEDQLSRVKMILDIDTAEGDQLDICGRIVGYMRRPSIRSYPKCEYTLVNDDLFRVLIKAKIYRNNSISTIDEIKIASDYIFNTETHILDGQDMTLRMLLFSNDISIPVQQLVNDYDLIPRPQGVGVRKTRVLTYTPFGFGKYYSNFNRAPFWSGDGIKFFYNERINLSFNDDATSLIGMVCINNLSVSDLDVLVIMTDLYGIKTTYRAVTNYDGVFVINNIDQLGMAVARTMVTTLTCDILEIESRNVISPWWSTIDKAINDAIPKVEL